MNIINTTIPDVKILEPKVFGDERGFFMETFRDNWFKEHVAQRTFVCLPTTNASFGCPKVSRTAFMCWKTTPNLFTNAPIITTPKPSIR